MASSNIFLDEWKACLYAHYLHVVHEGDDMNENSLRRVLLTVGFTEPELERVRAELIAERDAAIAMTAQEDDLPSAGDIVSPADVQPTPTANADSPVAQPAPAPTTVESLVAEMIAESAEPDQPILDESSPPTEEEPESDDEGGSEPDNPVQMSLF